MSKTLQCPKGQWTKIIDNFGTGYPRNFTVRITTQAGEPVAGEYLEKRYMWIFPEVPVRGTLKPEMHFHRKWINGIYSVAIRPTVDVVVVVQ